MDKASLRARMRSVGPLPHGVSDRITAGLFTWLSQRLPGTITAFLPMEGEVDLRPLFERLPGWRWALPRVEPDRSLNFRDVDVPREMHPFGMEQPSDTGPLIPLHEIDVFLVPGLAFDRNGRRLGNGAGHYDRILSAARADALTVGIVPDLRLVDEVPTDAHDQLVDWLATEGGVVSSLPRS
jgi:5-formyltetrahydrofolate cyclo-ligase